jgi:hypothetical protein
MSLIEWLTVVSLSLGIIAALGKFLIVTPIKNYIKEQTYPLQPHANGGRSVPDIARSVNRIEQRLDEHINLHLKDEV